MPTIRLRRRVRNKEPEIYFPDDINVNILSRLPAEDVLLCRLVCRRWRDLTSTHNFNELHFRHGIPMIVVSRYAYCRPQRQCRRRRVCGVKNFLLDKWWEPERRSLVWHKFVVESEDPSNNAYWGKFSHGGLVVFEQQRQGNVIILNPTGNKNVEITLSEELWGMDSLRYFTEIYGVFFHPSVGEYCTLWKLKLGVKLCYKMLNLGSKPCWKEINNPWCHKAKIRSTYPVLIGECLYWLVEPEQKNSGRGDIMEFHIRSENFSFMHCPVPLDVCCVGSEINLLDINGVLSFVLISRKQNEKLISVNIWKLNDGAQQLWIPLNHSIMLEDCCSSAVPLAPAVVGENLLLSLGQKVHVCNLELGTTRTLLKEDRNPARTIPHVMSLASLKNCKSKICMDKEGEVARS